MRSVTVMSRKYREASLSRGRENSERKCYGAIHHLCPRGIRQALDAHQTAQQGLVLAETRAGGDRQRHGGLSGRGPPAERYHGQVAATTDVPPRAPWPHHPLSRGALCQSPQARWLVAAIAAVEGGSDGQGRAVRGEDPAGV